MRNLIKTSTLLAGIVLLVGCDRNEPGSGEGRTSVTVQLNWVPEPEFGGIYQAQIDGIFKDEGLNVVIRPGSAGVSAPQLADTGDVEFALVGGSQILLLNAQGGELIALFAIFQDDPHAIMVPVDSPFKSLRALWSDPDAVIGAEGDLAFIRAINLKFGVPNGARHVAYNLPAFRAGRQQASQCFMMAEPVSLELAGFKTRVFMANESGFNEYNTVLVTRRSFLASNRATCVAMVRSFSKGWSAYLASPERANKVMAGLNPAMSDESMALSAKRQVPLIQDSVTERFGLGYMTKERWQSLGEQLVDLKLLERAPSGETVFEWLLPDVAHSSDGLSN